MNLIDVDLEAIFKKLVGDTTINVRLEEFDDGNKDAFVVNVMSEAVKAKID